MKLSILMLTCNHEEYLAQALESVLMQQVTFPYEIVVGEDCSSDGTRSVLLEYQRRYPDIIRPLLPEKNLGMMRNLMATYAVCRGEYIAILDGDDYWTSPQKLQKQVDFLDANQDFAICFHNAIRFVETTGDFGSLLCREDQKDISILADLMAENFIPTLTVMFRNRLIERFPDWFESLTCGDWPLHLLNAQYGKIKYLNETMAVYRLHPGGAATGAITDARKYLGNIEGLIEIYERFNVYYDLRYDSIIKKRIPDYCLLACMKADESGRYFLAAKWYLKYLRLVGPIGLWTCFSAWLQRNMMKVTTV